MKRHLKTKRSFYIIQNMNETNISPVGDLNNEAASVIVSRETFELDDLVKLQGLLPGALFELNGIGVLEVTISDDAYTKDMVSNLGWHPLED